MSLFNFQPKSISEYFNYYTFDFTKLFENNSDTEDDEVDDSFDYAIDTIATN